MGFFKTGFESREDARKVEAAERTPRVQRFRLKEGEERRIILLDDEPVCIWEHTVNLGKFWDNIPCARGVFEDDPRCVLCDQDSKRYWIGFLTCLDIKGYEYEDRKTGKTVQVRNVRRLFPMKIRTLDKFARYKERRGSLVGWEIMCSRTGQYQPSCGDDFEFIREVDVFNDKKYFWEDREGKLHAPEPYEYERIIVPLTNEQIKRKIAGGMDTSFDFGANASSPDELEY